MRTCRYLPLLALLAMPVAIAQTDTMEEEVAAPPRYAVEIILFRYAESVPDGNEVFLPDPPPEPPADEFLLPGFGDDENDVPVFGDRPANPLANPQRDGDAQLPPLSGDMADDTLQAGGDPNEPGDPGKDSAEAPEEDLSLVPLEEIILPTRRIDLRMTPREELTLADTWDKLELLDAYEPVMWAGWSQQVIARDQTPTIPLRRIGNAPPVFDGNLQLYLSRYLHLVVDLTLTPRQAAAYGMDEPATFRDRRNRYEPQARVESGVVRLRIDEDRIVKNGDLRYFDHPRFGLLAKITRIEEEEEEAPVEDVESMPAE